MAKKKSKAAPAVEKSGLTLGRELFCRYITQNSDTFGNGALSYSLAFGYKLDELSREPEYEGEGKKQKILPSEYDRACAVCATEAARLLRIPEVLDRVRVLLNELLKDNVVDARLAEHIMHVDDGDLSHQGIKEYNKLRGRIIDKTRDVTERFAMDDIRELLALLPRSGKARYMQSSPPLSQRQSYLEALRRAKTTILGNPEDIRRRFGNKLRVIFTCLWLQQDMQGRPTTRFIMKGPRGGGKSKLLGALGFVKWFLQLLNIIDMGGSPRTRRAS